MVDRAKALADALGSARIYYTDRGTVEIPGGTWERIREALAAYDTHPAKPNEIAAMEAVMETIDPAIWPGLTIAHRAALGRFAKPADPRCTNCNKHHEPGKCEVPRSSISAEAATRENGDLKRLENIFDGICNAYRGHLPWQDEGNADAKSRKAHIEDAKRDFYATLDRLSTHQQQGVGYPQNENDLREILDQETRRHWTIEAARGILEHNDSPSSRAALAAMKRAIADALSRTPQPEEQHD